MHEVKHVKVGVGAVLSTFNVLSASLCHKLNLINFFVNVKLPGSNLTKIYILQLHMQKEKDKKESYIDSTVWYISRELRKM